MKNPIDVTLRALNPSRYAKRVESRIRAEALESYLSKQRAYDGAMFGRRQSGWMAPATSGAAESESGHVTIRNRVREQVRNNAWAARAKQVIVANTIGDGLSGSIVTPRAGKKARLQSILLSWAEKDCDANRVHNLAGLQRLMLGAIVESGAVFAIRQVRPGQEVPVSIKVLEADYLDTSRDIRVPQGDGRVTYNGIEYDSRGVVTGYWLYDNHPGDRITYSKAYGASRRWDARDVLYGFRVDRPGQTLGISWFHPVMMPLRDLDGYEDAQLLKQKLSACYTVFVTDTATNTPAQTTLPDKLEPGAIEILPPGRNVTFASPPAVTGYTEYVAQVLHKIAAGLGISYEALTGDYERVNFASGRMGWLEMWRNIDEWRWNMLVPQLLNPIADWFLSAVAISGERTDDVSIDWTAPRRPMLKPSEDIAAKSAEIRNGLISWPEALREMGYHDPERVAKEIAEGWKLADENGLVLDCDPRKTTAQGQTQPPKKKDEAEESKT